MTTVARTRSSQSYKHAIIAGSSTWCQRPSRPSFFFPHRHIDRELDWEVSSQDLNKQIEFRLKLKFLHTIYCMESTVHQLCVMFSCFHCMLLYSILNGKNFDSTSCCLGFFFFFVKGSE